MLLFIYEHLAHVNKRWLAIEGSKRQVNFEASMEEIDSVAKARGHMTIYVQNCSRAGRLRRGDCLGYMAQRRGNL